jgi:hypothetical protein
VQLGYTITKMTDGMSSRKSKLAAIVPPPRSNTTRYNGILAPNAKQRAKVVPAGSTGNTPSEET